MISIISIITFYIFAQLSFFYTSALERIQQAPSSFSDNFVHSLIQSKDTFIAVYKSNQISHFEKIVMMINRSTNTPFTVAPVNFIFKNCIIQRLVLL